MNMNKTLLALAAFAASVLASASASATSYIFCTAPNPSGIESSLGFEFLGINDSGTIVGLIDEADGSVRGFTYSGGCNGTYTPFARDPGAFTLGINNAGTIVGQASSNTSPGFVDSSTFRTFEDPNSDTTPNSRRGTTAVGINNSGNIVGNYTDTSNVTHGFLLSGDPSNPASYKTIDPSGSTSTFANGINDLGLIAGAFTDTSNNIPACASPTDTHGFVLNGDPSLASSYTTIDVPNSCKTVINGLNNSGLLVGLYRDLAGNNQGFTDLGGIFTTISDPSSIDGTIVEGVNNLGDLVGTIDGADGLFHGFIAVPIPEPTPLAFVGAAFVAVGAFARKRMLS
jgi:hypothetical protein